MRYYYHDVAFVLLGQMSASASLQRLLSMPGLVCWKIKVGPLAWPCCQMGSLLECSPGQSRPVSAGKPPRPTSAGARPVSGRVRPISATLAPILEDSYASQESIMSGRASPFFPEAAGQKGSGATSEEMLVLVVCVRGRVTKCRKV